MNTTRQSSPSRVEREVEREREERHKNDDAKSGIAADDDFRMKDARDSASSSNLHRARDR